MVDLLKSKCYWNKFPQFVKKPVNYRFVAIPRNNINIRLSQTK